MNVFVCLFVWLLVSCVCVECHVRWFSVFSDPALHFAVTDDGHFAFSFLSVRVADGKLYHPDGAWDLETVYVTVYSKRKFIIVAQASDQTDEGNALLLFE